MPTPLEILLDPISLVVIAIFAGLMLWESLAPGRRLPGVRGWRLKGVAAFGIFFFLSSYLPLLWDEHLGALQLLDLSALGTVGGWIAGVLVYEFGVYWWHRSMHSFTPLWRSFHQLHHSAERLDVAGAFWFSPLDMIGWTLLSSLSLVLVIGITPTAATLVLLTTTFLGVFQHTNIRTPRWLGYIIQRPESHTVHHAKGVHFYNFSDLPLFDILFGTFRNPRSYEHETGFYPGASARLLDMLLFRAVSEQPVPQREVAEPI